MMKLREKSWYNCGRFRNFSIHSLKAGHHSMSGFWHTRGDSVHKCFAPSSRREQRATALQLIVRIPWRKQNNPNPSFAEIRLGLFIFGTPEGIRTSDLPLRRRLLCPAELLVHIRILEHFTQFPVRCQGYAKKF